MVLRVNTGAVMVRFGAAVVRFGAAVVRWGAGLVRLGAGQAHQRATLKIEQRRANGVFWLFFGVFWTKNAIFGYFSITYFCRVRLEIVWLGCSLVRLGCRIWRVGAQVRVRLVGKQKSKKLRSCRYSIWQEAEEGGG